MTVTVKERALMRKLAAVIQRWRKLPRKDALGAIPCNTGTAYAADELNEIMTTAYGSQWRAIQALSDSEGVKGEG